MNKFFTLPVNRWMAAFHSTNPVENGTALYHAATNGHKAITDKKGSAAAASFLFSGDGNIPAAGDQPSARRNDKEKEKKETAINDSMQWKQRMDDDLACYNTSPNNYTQQPAGKTKPRNNDAIRPFASLSFFALTKNFISKIFLSKTTVFAIALVIANLFLSQLCSAQGPGAAWTSSTKITLSPVTPSANFQVKVTLTSYTNMKADGSDLRFYDNTNTNCEYWIETWNTSGTSTIWVKVAASGADLLTMYYGNASASAVSNGNNTFDFFDDFTSALGANWTTNITGGSVTQSSIGTGTVTLSNTNGGTVSLSNTSAFTPASSSFALETKHREVGYMRNRFYATTSSGGGCPPSLFTNNNDYGYFIDPSPAQTISKIYWDNAFSETGILANNTDYLTQWQITDGSAYNWTTSVFSTGATIDSRSATYASNIRYISFQVTEVANTSTIVDWVRVRKFATSEPVAFVGLAGITYRSSTTFTPPAGVTSVTVQAWGAGGGGSTRTSNGARGGGGGGGAYASSVVSVTPGTPYPVSVGTGGAANTAGGPSTFNTSTVVAAGGSGAANNSSTGANGGTTGGSTGTTKIAGGNGDDGGSTYSGGGGGAAGTSASNSTPGVGSGLYGGTGGVGLSGSFNGNNGLAYGGGGAGAVTNSSTDRTGGSGANGQVLITWAFPCPSSITATATWSDVTCFNTNTGTITVNVPGTGTAPFEYSIDNGTHYFNASGLLNYIGGAPNASFDATGTTTKSFNFLPTGVYKIRIKDFNGCESKSVQ